MAREREPRHEWLMTGHDTRDQNAPIHSSFAPRVQRREAALHRSGTRRM
jgi:hypothetical protein